MSLRLPEQCLDRKMVNPRENCDSSNTYKYPKKGIEKEKIFLDTEYYQKNI